MCACRAPARRPMCRMECFARFPGRSCIRRSPGASSPRSRIELPRPLNRDDDLADLLIGLEVAVRLDDVGERERAGDDGLQMPGLKSSQNELACSGKTLGLVPDR